MNWSTFFGTLLLARNIYINKNASIGTTEGNISLYGPTLPVNKIFIFFNPPPLHFPNLPFYTRMKLPNNFCKTCLFKKFKNKNILNTSTFQANRNRLNIYKYPMDVYYKGIKSNRKTSKRLYLVRGTVIAQDNTPFLVKVDSASSGIGLTIAKFTFTAFFIACRHFNVLKSSL